MRYLLAAVLLASLPGLFGARASSPQAAPAQPDAAKAKACENARKQILAEPACADEARSAEQIRCAESSAQIWPLARACDDKTGKSIIPRTKPLKGSTAGSSAAVSSPGTSSARPPKPKKHSTFVEYTPTPTP